MLFGLRRQFILDESLLLDEIIERGHMIFHLQVVIIDVEEVWILFLKLLPHKTRQRRFNFRLHLKGSHNFGLRQDSHRDTESKARNGAQSRDNNSASPVSCKVRDIFQSSSELPSHLPTTVAPALGSLPVPPAP